MAYSLRGINVVFGNTLTALNLYAAGTLLGTAFFVYQISNLLSNNRQISLTASLLWLISLTTQHTLVFRGGNYDNLELLFWCATVYFVLDYLRHKFNGSLYFAGISVGLLLLSKYSGIILVLGLLVFFIRSKEERVLFKNKHLYGAGLVAFLIFSPNFLWNAQHHWLTFLFQLHEHLDEKSPLALIFKYLRDLLSYHGFTLLLVVLLINKHGFIQKNKQSWALLWTITVVLLLFWLFFAYFSSVRISYLIAINVLLICLLAHYLLTFNYLKTLWFTIVVGLITSLALVLKFEFVVNTLSQSVELKLLKSLKSLDLIHKKAAIVSGGNYQLLAKLAFLNPDNLVSSTPLCEDYANQFRAWNLDFQQALIAHQIPRVVYVDYENTLQCIRPYFNYCTQLPTLEYRSSDQKTVLKRLYVYQCEN